ncbi:MAG: hypothetical protein ACOYN6_09635 [Ignavibacteria bacterium]
MHLTADELPTTGVTVSPGDSKTILAEELGDVDANTYLMIRNLDALHDGKYKVTV